MKHNLSYTAVIISLGLTASTALAQTTANGPYYATPSWDQTLPSNTRFIVLSNMGGTAVLDRETGLVWERSPDATVRNWQDAQVQCINSNLGGRGGWKLPSIQELRSLIDPTRSNPALPAGHPFTNVGSFYWSASAFSGTTSAWAVAFGIGDAFGLDKSESPFVWCVRGGPGVDSQ
jgi:hypothetical protein